MYTPIPYYLGICTDLPRTSRLYNPHQGVSLFTIFFN